MVQSVACLIRWGWVGKPVNKHILLPVYVCASEISKMPFSWAPILTGFAVGGYPHTVKLSRSLTYCFTCSGRSWTSFSEEVHNWGIQVGCNDRKTLPSLPKEMPSHICLYLEVPIVAFFFSGDPPQIFATEGTRIPQKIYELKHQTDLLLPNTLPFLSLSLYAFLCMSADIFNYPFNICDPLMFPLNTRGHTEVSARPRHFQNHSMIFCMELLRIEPII